MRSKIFICVVCSLVISTAFVIADPFNTKSTTSSTSIIEYQIGVRLSGQVDNWSPLSSDGEIARVTTIGMTGTMDFITRIEAPGYSVNYQIGLKLYDEDDNWSPWSSDGAIARVTTYGLTGIMDFILRIEVPGYHVEYQIGFRLSDKNDSWSPWSSDGEIARATTNGFTGNMDFMMKVILFPSLIKDIDIDPNTLNLKSKGNWITCYITFNEPYDPSDIDISSILLENTIPAEWGNIQGDRLMVKFDRSAVQALLPVGTYYLKVTGELIDGTSFEGYSDEIRVIDPGK